MTDCTDRQKTMIFGANRLCIDLLASFRGLTGRISRIVHTGGGPVDPYFSDLPVISLSEYTYTPGEKIVFMETYTEDQLPALGIPVSAVIPLRLWLAGLLRNPEIIFQPWRVRIDICTLCQLHCRDCHMRDPEQAAMGYGYIPVQTFRQFIDENPFVLSIEISNNGEPLIHPDLHEILTYAHEKNVEISLWNGTNFNDVSDEVLEDLVKYGIRRLNIAIDGACQQTYEIYRRNGSFDKVIMNIRKINALKEKYHTEYPHLEWQFVMMKHNFHEMEKARQMASGLGMTIQFRDSWNPREREAVAALQSAGNAQNPAGPGKKHEHNTFAAYCSDLLYHPQINWDGRLLGCCQIFKSDWHMNVFEQGYLPCINSGVYRDTLASILEGAPVSADIPCWNCRQKPKTAEDILAVISAS